MNLYDRAGDLKPYYTATNGVQYMSKNVLGYGATAVVVSARREADRVIGSLKIYDIGTQSEAEERWQLLMSNRRLHRYLKEKDTLLNAVLPYSEEVQLKNDATENGQPAYLPAVFTPENIAGITFEDYARQGADTPAKLLQLLYAVRASAGAAQRLHNEGCLLLDAIKPGNVLLCYSAAGDNTVSRDAISLFDADDLVLLDALRHGEIAPEELPYSDFSAPELGTEDVLPSLNLIGEWTDLYALGQLLLFCFTKKPETGSATRQVVNGCYWGVVSESFLAKAAKLIELSTQKNTVHRKYSFRNGVSSFIEELERIIAVLEKEIGAAKEMLAKKQDADFGLMVSKLLMEQPLTVYLQQGVQRVLVLGGSEKAAQKTLAAVLNAGQTTAGLQVAYAGEGETVRSLRAYYEQLQAEYPFLFQIADGWTDEFDYAKAGAQLCFTECHIGRIRELLQLYPAGYILIADDELGRNLSQAVPAVETGRRFVGYLTAGTVHAPDLNGEHLVIQAFSAELLDDIFMKQANEFGEMNHIIYEQSRDPHIDITRAKKLYYESDYYRSSSLDAALTVAARLFAAGVDPLLMHKDPARAAELLEVALNAPGSSLTEVLAYLEHRRWCITKALAGFVCLPEESYGQLISGGNDGQGTRVKLNGKTFHALMVSSQPVPPPVQWRFDTYAAHYMAQDTPPEELDELDRVNYGLFRFFCDAAQKTDTAPLEAALQHLLAGCSAAKAPLEEYLQAIARMSCAQPACGGSAQQLYFGAAAALKKCIGTLPEAAPAVPLLQSIELQMFPLLRRSNPVDYRQLDWAFITGTVRMLRNAAENGRGEV